MKIETKYNIGDKVWWTTLVNYGEGIVKNVEISVTEHGQRITYKVYITRHDIHLTFEEVSLFRTEQELIDIKSII